MNKLSLYHIATIVLPILSLMIAGGVAYYEINRLHELEADLARTEQQITSTERTIAATRSNPGGSKHATAVPSPHEQTDFLNWLRMYANLTHVQITRWSNAPAASTSAAGNSLPAGVTPLESAVEISGQYNNMRQFLYNVEHDSPRLLNLSNTNWSRGTPPLTRLTFTLTRYLAPQAAGEPEGVTTSSAAPGAAR
jgi:hypothetical protein